MNNYLGSIPIGVKPEIRDERLFSKAFRKTELEPEQERKLPLIAQNLY